MYGLYECTWCKKDNMQLQLANTHSKKVHKVSREKKYLSHVYVIFENGLLLS